MGGAERQFVELIKNIDKTKFDVTLYLYAENEPLFYKDIYEMEAVTIIKQTLDASFKLLKIAKAIFRVRNFLKLNDFDIIQTTLVLNGTIVRAASVGLPQYKNRIVTSLRNNFNNYPIYIKNLEKLFIKKSFTIANTKYSSEQFKKYCNFRYNHRIHYIYNGFDTSKFKKRKAKNSNSYPTIGSVGRLTKPKNHMQFLKAVKNINTHVSVYLIGDDGSEKYLINNYIQNEFRAKQIKLLSYIVEIESYYNEFDIFVLPSKNEGCPNVLFEAMLSKCLCIVSSAANTDNFIKHNQNGLVYDNTENGLTKCLNIAIAICNQKEGLRIANIGYNYAKKHFSIQNMVTKYQNFYFNILKWSR